MLFLLDPKAVYHLAHASHVHMEDLIRLSQFSVLHHLSHPCQHRRLRHQSHLSYLGNKSTLSHLGHLNYLS